MILRIRVRWKVVIGLLAMCSGMLVQEARGEWLEHHIRQGDGQGGWVTRPARRQVLRHPDCEHTMPFGLVQMDNGEIAILVSREKANPAGGRIFEPNIAFSKDDGKTWSELQFLFEAGRHHANLQRMPNGGLVCTLIVRDDIQAGLLHKGELTSYRRGCDALVSHDHGETWNLDRRYELDSFEFLRADGYWVDGVCGHIGAVALDDGYMLAVYGNYPVGAVLIKWKPEEFRLLPQAPQKVHAQRVPHLNRQGERLTKYTPGASFFPIGLYHGLNYEDSNEPDQGTLETPFDKVAQAHFNYVHTNRTLSGKYLDRLQQHGLMMVKSEARPAHAEAFGDHPAILGWDVFDEPDSDGNFAAYPSRFELFDQFKMSIRQHDPVRAPRCGAV